MASKSNDEAVDLVKLGKQVEAELTCSICKKHFVNPKTLPCFHSFCLGCLKSVKLEFLKGSHFLSCPICPLKCPISSEGLAALTSSFAINYLVEVQSLIKKISDDEHSCDNCAENSSANKANHYCKQCAKFLCPDCLHRHDDQTELDNHETITLEEVANTIYSIPGDEHAQPFCPNHSKPLELFCMTCQCLICEQCIAKKLHRGHNHDKVLLLNKEAYDGHLSLIKDLSIDPLNKEIDKLKKAKTFFSNQIDEIAQQRDAAVKKIDDMVAEFRSCLDNEESKLKGNLKFLLKIKLSVLKQQMSDVDRAMSQLTKSRDHIDLSLKVGSRHDVLPAKDDIACRSEGLITAVVHNELFDQKEQAEIKLLQKNIDPRAVFGDMAVVCLNSVPKCKITLSDDKDTPLVNVESTASVSFFLQDGVPVPIPDSVGMKCYLTSCSQQDSPRVDCKLTKSDKLSTAAEKLYQIAFTPKSRGRHQLHVTIQDTEVQGSPVDIHVTIPCPPKNVPTDPIKTLTGRSRESAGIMPISIREPRGITISGEVLIISDGKNHCITIVDKEDGCIKKTISSLGAIKGSLKSPRGVAITSANTILVADKNNHRIQEFTMEGVCKSSVGSKGDGHLQFNCPHGLFIDKATKRIFITDHGNNRVVVLNPDMTYSYSFPTKGTHELAHPQDITIDAKGFAYVLDEHCNVHRFTTEGQFDFKFSHSKEGIPGCGITADGSNQLFINGKNGQIIVLNATNGKFKGVITDKYQNSMGGCKYQSICYDFESGYLFTCSCLDNVIKVY